MDGGRELRGGGVAADVGGAHLAQRRHHRCSTARAEIGTARARARAAWPRSGWRPPGLAMPRPATSGAEPWTGSKSGVPAPSEAEGRRPMRAHHRRHLVGQDVAEQVVGQTTSKRLRRLQHLEADRVDVAVLELDVREALGHLDHHRAPEAGGLQDVGLVHRGHALAAPARLPGRPRGRPASYLLGGLPPGVERLGRSRLRGSPK